MSTDEPSSSSTTRRLCRTRAESVFTFIPSSTLREQAGTRTLEPSSSTTQTRHELTGVRVSSWPSVGVSMRIRRHASRMVDPARTSMSLPSTLTRTSGMVDDLQLRQPGGDRVGRRLAEAADRRVAHRLRDVAEQQHVGTPVTVGGVEHPLEDLLLTPGPHPARD